MLLKIAPYLSIKETEHKGRGVFTKKDIPAKKIIERSPVAVLSEEDRKHIDQTPLYHYLFEWGDDAKQSAVAWGYVSLYNHSYQANCEYFMDFDNKVMTIQTIRHILAGEELTINYNGDWNDQKKIWFETAD